MMQNLEKPSRVAYVDDDFELRQLVRAAFESYSSDDKIVVATCGSGQEMLSRLRELQPNLILLDLKMPEMSGPDMVDLLRENDLGKDIPVIFMTGETKVVMNDIYKALGVIGVIHKPFDIANLVDQINEIWTAEFGSSDQEEADGRVLSELMEDGEEDSFKA